VNRGGQSGHKMYNFDRLLLLCYHCNFSGLHLNTAILVKIFPIWALMMGELYQLCTNLYIIYTVKKFGHLPCNNPDKLQW